MDDLNPLRKSHQSHRDSLAQRRADKADELARLSERPEAVAGSQDEPELEYIPWGPDEVDGPVPELVACFESVQIEYATIRRAVGLLDANNRGTIIVTGADRVELLNSLVSQQLAELPPGSCTEGFWLNRQGRIRSDMRIAILEDRVLLDLDLAQASETIESLSEYVFTEDVQFEDASSRYGRLQLHGPGAISSLSALCGSTIDSATCEIQVGDIPITIARSDMVGEPGIHMFIPRDRLEQAWEALVGAGCPEIVPVGWLAFNTARIEAGTPLFNVDFTHENIPNETALLQQRVSFTKGCYVGQEVVARIFSLGRPKQVLVGLRNKEDKLPVAGGHVCRVEEPANPIGVVTSSTISPMLGAEPIAFAMVRSAHSEPGSTVLVSAEGAQVESEICAIDFLDRQQEA